MAKLLRNIDAVSVLSAVFIIAIAVQLPLFLLKYPKHDTKDKQPPFDFLPDSVAITPPKKYTPSDTLFYYWQEYQQATKIMQQKHKQYWDYMNAYKKKKMGRKR